MDERFKRVYEELYEDVLFRNFPVIPLKCRIMFDADLNNLIIQVAYANISDSVVDSVSVQIICTDASGTVLQTFDEHYYSMLNASPKARFGENTPAYTEETRITRASIIIKKVVFENGSIWENAENCAGEQAEEKKPFNLSGNILNQFKEEAGANLKSECLFEDYGTYWRCSCGMLNISESSKCAMCSADIEKLRVCFDKEYLSRRYDEKEIRRKDDIYSSALKLAGSNSIDELEKALSMFRNIKGWKDANSKAAGVQARIDDIKAAKRRATQEAMEKREAEEKKRKKKISIIAIAITVSALAAVLTVTVGIPSVKYSNAEKMFSDGQYDEAIEAFAGLDGFMDSEQKLLAVKYAKADKFQNDGNYDSAIKLFNELGKYNDAEDRVLDIVRIKADALFKEGKYYEVSKLLEALKKHSDADDKALDIVNTEADILFKEGKYDEASEMLEALEDYSDSAKWTLGIDYLKADMLFNEGNLDFALSSFVTLANMGYGDSADRANEIRYIKGENYLSESNYDLAMDVFSGLADSNYKDSRDKYDEACTYQYNEGVELYNNKEYIKASQRFIQLGDYKDSAEYMRKCVWEPLFDYYRNGETVDYTYIKTTPERNGLEVLYTENNQICTKCVIYVDKEDINITIIDTSNNEIEGEGTVNLEQIINSYDYNFWIQGSYDWKGDSHLGWLDEKANNMFNAVKKCLGKKHRVSFESLLAASTYD